MDAQANMDWFRKYPLLLKYLDGIYKVKDFK